MRLYDCMNGDFAWISFLLIQDAITTSLYCCVLLFAVKFSRTHKGSNESLDFAVSLAIVFSICGVCGYAIDWLGMIVPHYKLKAVLLVPLNIFTSILVVRLVRLYLIDAKSRNESDG